MQQALEAFGGLLTFNPSPAEYKQGRNVVAALRERLAQPEREEHINWLPEHKCGLYLTHNEHRDVYETIENYYEGDDFISLEEWREALAKDSVWVLHWYPNTPIGFNRIAASTLEAIEAKLKEKNT